MSIPFPKVQHVSDAVCFIARPREPLPSDDGPSVVILFGWLNARLERLLKYAAMYQNWSPATTVVIVSLTLPRRALLGPLDQVLQHNGVSWLYPSRSRGLIVHAFSSGGCWTLSGWSDLVLRSAPRPAGSLEPMPPVALIFDSCPGTDDVGPLWRGLLDGYNNFALRAILSSAFALAHFMRWFIFAIILWHRHPLPGTIARARAIIANSDVLPWSTACSPRRFVYPRVDRIVPSQDVEAYATALRLKGMSNIRLERFDEASHVFVMDSDPQRYWQVVRDAWKEALSTARAEGFTRMPLARL